MILYEVLYCPCIHESGYTTISIHRTKKGALKAKNYHENQKYLEWLKYIDFLIKTDVSITDSDEFGIYEKWEIREITVLE